MKLNRTLCYGFCALIAATAYAANTNAAYKPAVTSPLMTVWGEKMTPETAWQQHPRPNLKRNNWVNLNGMWDYAITAIDAKEGATPSVCDWQEPAKPAWQGQILVPFAMESALSGVGRAVQPNEAIWYHRTFDVNELNGDRLLLHFDGVDYRSQVFVNGIEVSEYPHESGILPQTIDATKAVRPGKNELVVYVWDPTDSWMNATGKQVLKPQGIMYTACSGIWQTVWMETVPSTYVTGYNIDSDIAKGIAKVTLKTKGNLMGAKATITVKDENGKKVASGKVKNWEKPVELKIKDAQLWSPDNPYLYTLDIALTSDGGTDKVEGYFGMREIKMGKDKNGANCFFLNGEKIYMQGTLDQGWWPDGLLTPPSEEALKFDIQFLKDAGFNMMRKHIKIEPMLYYYWCDKLGIMVWQDMTSGPGNVNARYGSYRRELKGMMDLLQPIPSIVVWVPYNEGWGEQEAFKANATLRWVQNYDKTRLVDGPSGWTDHGVGDTKDMHNYPGPGMFDLMPKRISVLGEFGGLGLVIADHTWKNEGAWGYVSDKSTEDSFARYTSLMTRLSRLAGKGLAASVYTQTTDVEIENNGLLTYDRKVDKYGRANLKKLHDMVYAGAENAFAEKTIMDAELTWLYTTQTPANGWQTAEGKDGWREGKAGFGNAVIKKDNRNAKVNTEWETDNLWLRRDFEWNENLNAGDIVYLEIFYDQDPVIYLNGVEIARYADWNGSYSPMDIDMAAFRKAIKKGKNTIAVELHNLTGGAYFDMCIKLLSEKK